jgi:hypothetical protein
MANVIANRRTASTCCGPFAQKRRRLDQIAASIKELEAALEAGRSIGAELAEALAEEKRLRNWIARHEHRKE